MSRAIGNAVSSIARKRTEEEIQQDLYSKQWHDIKHRIDGLLLSGNILKSNEVKKLCQQLDAMDFGERVMFIQEKFGPSYYRMIEPLLQQLDTIERAYRK